MATDVSGLAGKIRNEDGNPAAPTQPRQHT
jgi:hypothetical protein